MSVKTLLTRFAHQMRVIVKKNQEPKNEAILHHDVHWWWWWWGWWWVNLRQKYTVWKSLLFRVSVLGTNLIRFFLLGSSAEKPDEHWGLVSLRSLHTAADSAWVSNSKVTWRSETKLPLLSSKLILDVTLHVQNIKKDVFMTFCYGFRTFPFMPVQISGFMTCWCHYFISGSFRCKFQHLHLHPSAPLRVI